MKPLIRGYIHQIGFYVALGACLSLIVKSHGALTLLANAIYSITLISLYGISSLYHCFQWSHQKYLIMKSMDHTAIFALIAGSATPICLLGLKGEKGIELLLIMWTIAAIGILSMIFGRRKSKWIRTLIYVTLGWSGIFFLPAMKSSLGIFNMWLILLGGIFYTLGALIYAFKWPNPYPRVFGYHEIFHSLVVIASGLHFKVIYTLTS